MATCSSWRWRDVRSSASLPTASSIVADLSAITTCKCNDMVVDRSGNAYVGDFGYDLLAGAPPAPGVLALARPTASTAVVADDVHFPNGCVITPGEELIVAESAANRLTAFRIEPDGTLSNRRMFADLGEASPTASASTPRARCGSPTRCTTPWCASPTAATVLDRIPTRQGAFACELGGDDGRLLFVCTYDAAASASPEPQPIGRLEVATVEVPRA